MTEEAMPQSVHKEMHRQQQSGCQLNGQKADRNHSLQVLVSSTSAENCLSCAGKAQIGQALTRQCALNIGKEALFAACLVNLT